MESNREEHAKAKPRSRRLLSVAVTRARHKTLVMGPSWKRCSILPLFVPAKNDRGGEMFLPVILIQFLLTTSGQT